MVICPHCKQDLTGKGTRSQQDLLQKKYTDSENYKKIILCIYCHNEGPDNINVVGSKLLKTFISSPDNQIPTQCMVNKNLIYVSAGSIDPTQTLVLPNNIIGLMFEGKNKELVKGNLIRHGNQVMVSGTNLLPGDYSYYVLLSTSGTVAVQNWL